LLYFTGLHAEIQGLTNRSSTVEFTNLATSSDKVTAALSGAKSIVDIAPAVTDGDRPASSSRDTDPEVLPEASLPPAFKQLETAASASPPVKVEKVNVAQLKLVQQSSSSSETSIHR